MGGAVVTSYQPTNGKREQMNTATIDEETVEAFLSEIDRGLLAYVAAETATEREARRADIEDDLTVLGEMIGQSLALVVRSGVAVVVAR